MQQLSAQMLEDKVIYTWDGSSIAGQTVPAGIYYYRNMNGVNRITISGSVTFVPE